MRSFHGRRALYTTYRYRATRSRHSSSCSPRGTADLFTLPRGVPGARVHALPGLMRWVLNCLLTCGWTKRATYFASEVRRGWDSRLWMFSCCLILGYHSPGYARCDIRSFLLHNVTNALYHLPSLHLRLRGMAASPYMLFRDYWVCAAIAPGRPTTARSPSCRTRTFDTQAAPRSLLDIAGACSACLNGAGRVSVSTSSTYQPAAQAGAAKHACALSACCHHGYLVACRAASPTTRSSYLSVLSWRYYTMKRKNQHPPAAHTLPPPRWRLPQLGAHRDTRTRDLSSLRIPTGVEPPACSSAFLLPRAWNSSFIPRCAFVNLCNNLPASAF